MKDTIIKAQELFFSYEDGTSALNGITLEIGRGKKVAFMGANGSGKSTFFLCLNGINKLKAGELFYDGKCVGYSKKELIELRRRVGIVFQDPDNQLFSANVLQEVCFGLLNLGFSQQESLERAQEVMDKLGISQFANKPTHTLSGGQKKLVCIAGVLVMSPDVVILDEPAAALDPKHTELVNSIIDDMTKNGITVIISTHDIDFAYEWADEAVIFNQGKVLFCGDPIDAFKNEELLYSANLHKPSIIQFYEMLKNKGLIDKESILPRNLAQLSAAIIK